MPTTDNGPRSAGPPMTRCDRAETVLDELSDYPLVRPGGGWSLLVDAGQLGLSPVELSERLLTGGKVVATPTNGWGRGGDRHVRLVFANEPVHRLTGLAERLRAALA